MTGYLIETVRLFILEAIFRSCRKFNPISTNTFFDACVPRGGVSVGSSPLKMAFLLQKCANFGPEMKFGKILARF